MYDPPEFDKLTCIQDSVSVLWSTKLKAYPQKIIELDSSSLLIGDSRGGLQILNVRTGKQIDYYWKDYMRPIKLYNVINNILYFSAENENEIIAWDLKKAKVVWKQKYKINITRLFKFNKQIFIKYQTGIGIINSKNGEIKRKTSFQNRIIDNYVLRNNKILCLTESGKLISIDSNLKIIDKYKTDISLPQNILLNNDHLVIHNSSGLIKILNLQNEEVVYSKKYDQTIYSSPQFMQGHLIIAFASGKTISLDYSKNTTIWEFSYPGLLSLDCIAIDNKIILPYSKGIIFCLNSTDGSEYWKYQAEKSINYVKLTHRGILYSSGKKLILIGNKK
ncbi:MAG: hypothetical protein K9M80_05775 [Candidatus Marinimicrobia bacterium]|nr:hypothetical protein [Candidatus Neomarinimicrobiota bacterium]